MLLLVSQIDKEIQIKIKIKKSFLIVKVKLVQNMIPKISTKCSLKSTIETVEKV